MKNLEGSNGEEIKNVDVLEAEKAVGELLETIPGVKSAETTIAVDHEAEIKKINEVQEKIKLVPEDQKTPKMKFVEGLKNFFTGEIPVRMAADHMKKNNALKFDLYNEMIEKGETEKAQGYLEIYAKDPSVKYLKYVNGKWTEGGNFSDAEGTTTTYN